MMDDMARDEGLRRWDVDNIGYNWISIDTAGYSCHWSKRLDNLATHSLMEGLPPSNNCK